MTLFQRPDEPESCLREVLRLCLSVTKQRVNMVHSHAVSAYGNCADIYTWYIFRLIDVLLRYVPELACSSYGSHM